MLVVADRLRDCAKIYPSIILAGHSMGGILARAAVHELIDRGDSVTLASISGLLMLASPIAGSLRVPGFLWWVSADMRALRAHGPLISKTADAFTDRVVASVAQQTNPNQFVIPTWVVAGAEDNWVDPFSAGLGITRDRINNVRGWHTSVVKPRDRTDDVYTWVRDIMIGATNVPPSGGPSPHRVATNKVILTIPQPSPETRDTRLSAIRRVLIFVAALLVFCACAIGIWWLRNPSQTQSATQIRVAGFRNQLKAFGLAPDLYDRQKQLGSLTIQQGALTDLGGYFGRPIESSYHLRQALPRRDMLIRLIELCRPNLRRDAPLGISKELALTLFHVATTERDLEWRTVGEKNAAACFSYVDPVAAMELLSKVDFQRSSPGQWLYEDPRYNAAETIFVNLTMLKSFNVSGIAAMASYLGQTGQYPYVAVGKVIQRLPASLRKEANALLNDALTFYTDETGFYNRDEEFLRFLQALDPDSVDKALVSQALATFAQRLKNDPIKVPGDYYAEIHNASTGKVFPFTDRNEVFLFQAFLLIKRFNPALAAQLLQQDPTLGQATEKMSYISGGFVQGSPTSEQVAMWHLKWLKESLISHIKDAQDNAPQVAMALSQRLIDLNPRINGFTAASLGVEYGNGLAVRDILERQLLDLQYADDHAARLAGLGCLGPAYYYY